MADCHFSSTNLSLFAYSRSVASRPVSSWRGHTWTFADFDPDSAGRVFHVKRCFPDRRGVFWKTITMSRPLIHLRQLAQTRASSVQCDINKTRSESFEDALVDFSANGAVAAPSYFYCKPTGALLEWKRCIKLSIILPSGAVQWRHKTQVEHLDVEITRFHTHALLENCHRHCLRVTLQ